MSRGTLMRDEQLRLIFIFAFLETITNGWYVQAIFCCVHTSSNEKMLHLDTNGFLIVL